MALDGEDITAITMIIKRENDEQFARFSEKLELTVTPIRDNLQHHTAHDEKIHGDMYNKLSDLNTGQTELKTKMVVLGVVGCAGLGIATSVIAGVIKGFL